MKLDTAHGLATLRQQASKTLLEIADKHADPAARDHGDRLALAVAIACGAFEAIRQIGGFRAATYGFGMALVGTMTGEDERDASRLVEHAPKVLPRLLRSRRQLQQAGSEPPLAD